jgi:hypothetical protein
MLLFLMPVDVFATWRSPKDSKPVAELELMDDKELLVEATEVCGTIAIQNKIPFPNGTRERLDQLRLVVAGQQYLQTVSRVARKKNDGQMPAWVEEVRKTAEGADPLACVELSKRAK